MKGTKGLCWSITKPTACVRAAQVLVQRYQNQLRLYADAYFRMTGQRVARAVIYSFSLGCEIEVPLKEQQDGHSRK